MAVSSGWITLTLEVTTPLFNGGADPDGTAGFRPAAEAGVRVASLRGAMRYWFRALAGTIAGPDLALLARMEEAVFGSAQTAWQPGARLDEGTRIRGRAVPLVPRPGGHTRRPLPSADQDCGVAERDRPWRRPFCDRLAGPAHRLQEERPHGPRRSPRKGKARPSPPRVPVVAARGQRHRQRWKLFSYAFQTAFLPPAASGHVWPTGTRQGGEMAVTEQPVVCVQGAPPEPFDLGEGIFGPLPELAVLAGRDLQRCAAQMPANGTVLPQPGHLVSWPADMRRWPVG